MSGWVYILASQRNGTIYIGVTNDICRRIWEHREKIADGFTKKYRIDRLVYYEAFDSIKDAIVYEKRLKGWRRAWKIALIEKHNPQWLDRYDELFG